MKKIITSICCIALSILFMFSILIPVHAQQSADQDVKMREADKAKAVFTNRDEINEVSKKLGLKAKKYSKELLSDKVIGTINGEEILYKEFALKKLMCEVLAKTPKSNSEIFDLVIRDKVRIQIAKELNLYPSNEEFVLFTNTLRDDFRNADNPEVVQNFIDSYGITEEQYWNEWSKPFDIMYLVDTKLGKHFSDQIKTSEVMSDSYYEELKQIFDNEINNKLSMSIIEIHDNSLGLK